MWWDSWRTWFQGRSDQDFAAEIESHIAMEVERLVASGMSEEDARFAAKRAFGNVTAARERFHESRAGRLEWLEQDVRYGLRAMRRNPAFTAIAVASLAIGIGANTTMFGAIDALLIRTPAHVRDPDRILRLYFEVPSGAAGAQPWSTIGYGEYAAFRDGVQGFEALGAYSSMKVSSGRGTDARSIDAVLATPSFFTLLGVQPAIGRFFAPDEERDETEHVAVLGYDTWRARYASSTAALGQSIDVAGVPYVIVGVAPEGFTGVDNDRVDLWLPLGAATRLFSPRALDRTSHGYWLSVVGKQRDHVPIAQVEEAVTQLYRNLHRDAWQFDSTIVKTRAVLGPIVAARGPGRDANAGVAIWVGGVSLLVLLIACANVANLLLLRGFARSRETAMRLSLGATRWRLARQALVEGMLLAVAGAGCAIVIAHWSASAMQRFLMPKAAEQSVIDSRLLAFTAAIALGTGILASLVPAFVTARRDFGPLLSAGRASGWPSRFRLQRALIGCQVALAMLLLVGAGLFLVSLDKVRAIDLGIDAEHLLYVSFDAKSVAKAGDPNARASIDVTYEAMRERVRQVPGVLAATLSNGEPLRSGWALSLLPRGAPPLVRGARVPFGRGVGDDYFQTMGTTLVSGRFFNAADHRPNGHVAIIDETIARQYWPNGGAVGSCASVGSDSACTQIVGVVKNTVLWQVTGEQGSIVYVPHEAWPDQAISTMEIRTRGDPHVLIPAIRRAVSSVSPELPWVDVQPVSDRLAPQFRPWRLGASMFSAFGALAMCLAAVGLYGMLSYAVAQRTREIGVRKALGAPTIGLVRMVVGGAVTTTIVGIIAGLALALAAGRLIASQLYGVSPHDPTVMVGSALTLLVVAIVSCLAPIWRATRVDPVIALRAE